MAAPGEMTSAGGHRPEHREVHPDVVPDERQAAVPPAAEQPQRADEESQPGAAEQRAEPGLQVHAGDHARHQQQGEQEHEGAGPDAQPEIDRERQRERGDQRAHGDHLDEGAGQRDDGLRPGGAERVEDQQPPDRPDDPGSDVSGRVVRGSPRISTTAHRCARRCCPRPAGTACPATARSRGSGSGRAATKVHGPTVDVVVPAVVLLAGDRLGHPLALVRRPVRIGAVVGQHRHPAALHRAADDGRVQREAVVVDVHPLGLPPAVGVERCAWRSPAARSGRCPSPATCSRRTRCWPGCCRTGRRSPTG